MTNRQTVEVKPIKNSIFTVKKCFSDFFFVIAFASFISYLRPFGMDSMAFVDVWFFWSTICLCGLIIYSPTIFFTRLFISKKFQKYAIATAWQIMFGAILASMIMALVTPLIIRWYFPNSGQYSDLVKQSFITSLFIGGAITLGARVKSYLKEQKAIIAAQQKELVEQQPNKGQQSIAAFMEKIPMEKRGQLFCLEMDDHYLKVHTDKGCHLLLLRFKDALAMLENAEGMQTHRSWWVAKAAIKSSSRSGRKWTLMLANKIEVPVSQTYLPAVKPFL